MKAGLIVCFCVSVTLGGAEPPSHVWANVPSVCAALARDGAEAPVASLAVVNGVIDLGRVDGDKPVAGTVEIKNQGTQAYALIVPGGMAATPVCVEFPSPEVVVVPAGKTLRLPFTYDARLDNGPASFDVVLTTTDPGARMLHEHFTCTATHQFAVGPYRDLLSEHSKTVDFFFEPLGGGEKFVSASVEDPNAPVSLSVTPDPATGRLDGVATLDPSACASPALQGTTRIVGKTETGETAYFWLQWAL